VNPARAILDAAMSETAFQAQITDLCDTLRLPWFHDEDARRDNAGLPDLIIPAPPVLHIWELKTMRGRLRREQEVWGAYLARCREIDYRVLRPADWPLIEVALRTSLWRYGMESE